LRAGRAHRARPAGTARPRALIAVVVAGGCLAVAAGRTAQGRVILAALQRFLLFYSGVFALVALTAAVAAGLIATDRLVMTPPGRVISQAVHRALALAALGFLASHVLLEILAHRSRVIDAVVPFLASGRTLYLGLGTLASDLVLLVAVTSVARRRFATRRPGTWRVVHVTAYLAWPLAIVHGLLSGRHAKPYVDWSYGACLALVALAVMIRLLAASRGRSEVAGYPGPGRAAPGPPTATLVADRPAAWLPGQPPPRRALPGGPPRGTTRYRTGHRGAPRASGGR
jgi:DMSO/TMAO reductase YedYZ heme-binding membrane subunit